MTMRQIPAGVRTIICLLVGMMLMVYGCAAGGSGDGADTSGVGGKVGTANGAVRKEINVWRNMARQKKMKLLRLARLGENKIKDNRARTLIGYSFDGGKKAYDRGIRIVKMVRQGNVANLDRFLGQKAAFYGIVAPPGETADLWVAPGVLLHVKLSPRRDVRPQANAWTAGVVGIVKSIDSNNGVISIRAKPDHWAPFQTW